MVRLSALPLKAIEQDFAIDSTGFSSTQLVGQWKGQKYGDKQLRMEHDWLKVHAVTGVKTNVVVAVEVPEANNGDCPRFAPLLGDRPDFWCRNQSCTRSPLKGGVWVQSAPCCAAHRNRQI